MKAAKLFLLLILAAACADTPTYQPIRLTGDASANSFGGEVRPTAVGSDIPPRLWRVPAASFRRPYAVHALGEHRAVVLDRAAPFLHLIDTDRGEYLYPLTAIVEDSSESVRVDRIAPSPTDSFEFVGLDLLGNTVTAYRIGMLEKPLTALRSIRLSSVEAVDAPVWHADGSISVEPVRENALRARVGSDGVMEEPTGVALTADKLDWVPSAVWRDAMEGHTCASPDRSKLARTFQHMGQIMVLDAKGNRIPGSASDRFMTPQFEVRDPTGEVVFNSSGMARTAYRGCGATNEHVFALFAGTRQRATTGRPEPRALQVHVYNWRGWLLGGFRAGGEAVALDVTPSGRILLVLEGYTRVELVAYEVPRKFR
jgi:hypothetical protein